MNRRELLRQRAIERSKKRDSRAGRPAIIAITGGCDHIPGVDGSCVRCGEQVRSRTA